MRPEYGKASCPTCETEFSRLPVEYDGDNALVVLETKPCPFCFVELCACCNAKHCQDCGDFVCSEHIVIVPDGTPKPLELCPACAVEAQQMELLVPSCPQCQSQEIAYEGFDFGISKETGYHDAGEGFVCKGCGFSSDDCEELIQLPEAEEQLLPVRRIEPGREVREPGEEKKVA